MKDPPINMRDNLKNQTEKNFSFKFEFPLDKTEWVWKKYGGNIQCSQEILSFINKNVFVNTCTKSQGIGGHFQKMLKFQDFQGVSR